MKTIDMRNANKHLFTLAVALVLPGLIYLSRRGGSNVKAPLKLSLPYFAKNLDPHAIEDAYSYFITQNAYRGLFRYLPDGTLTFDLAKSYEVSPDGKEVTIRIRDDAKFSDGKPIQSRHVVASLGRIFAKSASIKSDLFYLRQPNFIRALNDFTVRISLSQRNDYWMKHLAMPDCAILPIAQVDEQIPAHVFSGPYLIERNSTMLRLKRWRSDRFQSQVPPDEIILREGEDFSENDDDWLMFQAISPEERNALVGRGWQYFSCESTLQHFAILNPEVYSPPQRAAIRMVVEEWKTHLSRPELKGAYGIFPNLFGKLYRRAPLPYTKIENSEIARVLPTLAIDTNISTDLISYVGQTLVEKFRAHGVEASLNPLTIEDYLDRLFKKKSNFIVARKAFDYYDPLSGLTYFRGDSESNYFRFHDQEFDRQLEKTLSMQSGERDAQFLALEGQVLNQNIFIPLAWGTDCVGLWSQKVKSVPVAPLGIHTIPLEMVEMR